MGRKGWGKAKLEVFANQSKIQKFVCEGLTHSEIYNILLEGKNLTCAYRTFRRHVRNIISPTTNIVPARSAQITDKSKRSLASQSPDKPKIFQIEDANSFSYNSEASEAHSNKSWKEE